MHNVTFTDVGQYSGILPDLAAFTTEYDSETVKAERIAEIVLMSEAAKKTRPRFLQPAACSSQGQLSAIISSR